MPKGVFLRPKGVCLRKRWHSEDRICEICRKQFKEYVYRIKKGFGKYCSLKCFGISRKKLYKDKNNHPRWKNFEVKRDCKICGRRIVTNQYKILKGQDKFCSRKCYGLSKHKKKILCECENCHKKFYVFPCQAEKRRFCSRRCIGLYMFYKRPIYNTLPELKIEEWLQQNRISYRKQVLIKDITIVDFFLAPNICLFVDGNYWHRPDINKGKDKRQNRNLKQNGYKVIRIWEKDIYKGIRPIELLKEKANA